LDIIWGQDRLFRVLFAAAHAAHGGKWRGRRKGSKSVSERGKVKEMKKALFHVYLPGGTDKIKMKADDALSFYCLFF
jgi:hypothetical protein